MCIFKGLNNKPAIIIFCVEMQYPFNRPLPTYRENYLSTLEYAKGQILLGNYFGKSKLSFHILSS